MRKSNWREFQERCGRPRRICWAVAEHEGSRSICPIGWKMNASNNPPMVAIGVAPSRFTHELVAKSGQFVLAWPGEDLAQATIFCGTRSGRDLDKFKGARLTPLKAEHVSAPLVAECIANLECRLVGQLPTGDHTIFVGEVLAAWINEHPRRVQCVIDDSGGYDFLIEHPPWRIGAVRR